MRKKKFLILSLLMIGSLGIHAQKKVKFGKVSKSDFAQTEYNKDPDAKAVVLFKHRQSYYDYDDKKGWILVTEVHERIRIFEREGFDYGTKSIDLYKGDEGLESYDVKAAVFNLEDNKVKKVPLENKRIFEEERSDSWRRISFTLPDIREGSIIEWHYKIRSPYSLYINDLICQYDIPIIHMTGSVQIPEYFVFNIHPSRYFYIHVHKSRKSNSYNVNQGAGPYQSSSFANSVNVNMMENIYSVELHHVPALKNEPYVNSMDNYTGKLVFELSATISFDGKDKKFYNTSWESVAKSIYANEKFGKELKRSAHFMPALNSILAQKLDSKNQIREIFDLVKHRIAWNGKSRIYTEKGIAEAFIKGEGNTAEINLNLVAMLQKGGHKAYPVLISTRNHGIPLYPTKKGYNSVIAAVESENGHILLDATDPYSIPGHLPRKDLNWQGTMIRSDGTWKNISLYPSKHQHKDTKASVEIDESGLLKGNMMVKYSGLYAMEYRERMDNVAEEDHISYLEKTFGNIDINNFSFRNEKELDKPVVEVIQFEADNQIDKIGDKIFISPLLFHSLNDNPFQKEKRKFPIDFGYPWKETKSVSITVPKNFTVRSVPEDLILYMPEGLGSLAIVAKQQGDKIVIQSDIRFNQPVIEVDKYQQLKNNYQKMLLHQEQKIVLERETNLQ